MISIFISIVLIPLFSGLNQEEINIGSNKQVIIDNYLIGKLDNTRLKLVTPQRREVVWIKDKDWEGTTSTFFTVFKDGEKFRMYYRGQRNDYTCYAESIDGINFVKPELGLITHKGNKKNNIIYYGSEASTFTPFLDNNPTVDKKYKYKALASGEGRKKGLMALVSEDGLRWNLFGEVMSRDVGWYDSQNVAFWNSNKKVYESFTRAFTKAGTSNVRVAFSHQDWRSVQYATTKDFFSWKNEPQFFSYAQKLEEHLYTSSTTLLPSNPNIYIAYPMRLINNRRLNPDRRFENSLSDVSFMSSRDGINWYKFKEAWIRPGTNQNNWTDRNMLPAVGLIETSTEEYSLYIVENYRLEEVSLVRYTIGRDRFASIGADADGGTWETPFFKLNGDNLFINFNTSASGTIKVAVIDQNGNELQGVGLNNCIEIYGDQFDRKVVWKNASLNFHRGKKVKLKFFLQDADIYSIQLR